MINPQWKSLLSIAVTFSLGILNTSYAKGSPTVSSTHTVFAHYSEVLGMAYSCIHAGELAHESAEGKCAELGYDGEAKILSTTTIENAKLNPKNPDHQEWLIQGYSIYCTVKTTARCMRISDESRSNTCSIV